MPEQQVPISNKLRQFIMRNEHHLARNKSPYRGFNPDLARFFAEPDSRGIATIGFGHRITEDEIRGGVFDRGLTFEQAMDLLDRDILTHQGHAAKVIGPRIFYGLPQDLRDAATALTFQVGRSGFRKFEKFRNALLAGDLEAARKETLTGGGGQQFLSRQRDLNETFLTPRNIIEDNLLDD